MSLTAYSAAARSFLPLVARAVLDSVADALLDRGQQRRVAFLDGELALGLARAALQLFLHREYRLHRLVRGEQRFEDRFFVDDLRAALEHHDRVGAGRDHQRDVAAFELADGSG